MTPVASYAINQTMQREGGLQTSAQAFRRGDPGGETNYGFTEATLRDLGEGILPRDLTSARATILYHRHYWRPFADLADVFPGLAIFAFDCGVQHGVRRATLWVQVLLGVKADGIIGPKTLGAAAQVAELPMLLDMAARRREFLLAWATRDERRLAMLVGLVRRVDYALRDAARWQVVNVQAYRSAVSLWAQRPSA